MLRLVTERGDNLSEVILNHVVNAVHVLMHSGPEK